DCSRPGPADRIPHPILAPQHLSGLGVDERPPVTGWVGGDDTHLINQAIFDSRSAGVGKEVKVLTTFDAVGAGIELESRLGGLTRHRSDERGARARGLS